MYVCMYVYIYIYLYIYENYICRYIYRQKRPDLLQELLKFPSFSQKPKTFLQFFNLLFIRNRENFTHHVFTWDQSVARRGNNISITSLVGVD